MSAGPAVYIEAAVAKTATAKTATEAAVATPATDTTMGNA
jgi:hypothetical protein